MVKKIGKISASVHQLLNLTAEKDTNIYIGTSNIEHMRKKHPKDFDKYWCYLREILKNPDYVGKNPKDHSIEYVKEFIDENQEYVKVAVRLSGKGKYFARSLYVLNSNRVKNFIRKGTLKSI